MFKVHDYVMYGAMGVCQVEAIVNGDRSNDQSKYYILHPVDSSNLTIKTPVNNPKVIMRPLHTKEEVLSLIATIPEQEPLTIKDKKERSESFKAVLRSGNSKELIKVIKTLHLEKKAKSAVNKKLLKSDEEIMNSAEKQLHEEFAIALNISPDEVSPFINNYIKNHKASM
jgi:CarD family transcriptional regulator